MAAHRSAKPAPDPLADAQVLIEQRIAAGDPVARRWLDGLLPPACMGAPGSIERLKPDRFDYSRIRERRLANWLMLGQGMITKCFGDAVVRFLEGGARLQSARLHLEPDLYRDWVRQACGLTVDQADALIHAAAAAPDMDELPEPWRLFELLQSVVLAGPAVDDGSMGPAVDVEWVPTPLADR